MGWAGPQVQGKSWKSSAANPEQMYNFYMKVPSNGLVSAVGRKTTHFLLGLVRLHLWLEGQSIIVHSVTSGDFQKTW